MKPVKKCHKSGCTVSFMHFSRQSGLLLSSPDWSVKRLYGLMIDFYSDLSPTSYRNTTMGQSECIYCHGPATHTMFQAINPLQAANNMDAEWAKAIQKQMNGDYTFALYSPCCDDCTLQFASIQLGKRRSIQHMLSMAEIAKRQQHINLSLVICVTVNSLEDEGTSWVMLAPDTTIEDVVRHINDPKNIHKP